MATPKKIGRKTSKLNEEGFVSSLCRENKLRKIGSGCFGTVYGSKSRKTVFKTGNADENDGYLAFVKYALKHQNNPWFPKIKNVTIYRSTKKEFNSYFVIEMERLKPLKCADDREEIVELLDSIINSHKAVTRLLKQSLSKTAMTNLSTMGKVLRTLFNNHCHDLHCNNVMKRANGQVVIIDPVC